MTIIHENCEKQSCRKLVSFGWSARSKMIRKLLRVKVIYMHLNVHTVLYVRETRESFSRGKAPVDSFLLMYVLRHESNDPNSCGRSFDQLLLGILPRSWQKLCDAILHSRNSFSKF